MTHHTNSASALLSPDEVQALAGALDDTLLLSQVEDEAKTEVLRRSLAQYIVEMAKAGERDRARLCVGALNYLDEHLQHRRSGFRKKSQVSALSGLSAGRPNRTTSGVAISRIR
jgi:hypothetical protein